MWSVGSSGSERPRSTDTDLLSDLFLATGSGSEGRGEMGGCSPGWPRFPLPAVRYGTGLDDGVDAEAPRDGGDRDEVRKRTVSTRV
jgi:hypothetical protein